ncbi:HEPN domain-containing protein [Dyadobacter sp. LJ53]|uniref:HEPN domain-containing protein n=1 Tax=Dyadobacter chenwenxiniae TaxID=2906456 RepID=UPI001F2E3E86|nr:HEPN domain-containing protein [Dyadobacter chenwenxiniae]MCF0053733.1 HEPN domain-containing protein [Dyadobacter chenwenxiniae]
MKVYSIDDIVSKMVDCLDAGRDLLASKHYDAVLNRSYYAMFHGIQALLFTINKVTKSHTGTHNAFHKEFILTGLIEKRIGLSLKRTFERRQFSDYEYDETSEQTAIDSFNEAEYFVHSIVQYLKKNNHL